MTRQNFFDRVTDKVVERMRASQKTADNTDVVPVGMEEVSAATARKRLQGNPKAEIKKLGLDKFLEGAVSPEVKAKMKKKLGQ